MDDLRMKDFKPPGKENWEHLKNITDLASSYQKHTKNNLTEENMQTGYVRKVDQKKNLEELGK